MPGKLSKQLLLTDCALSALTGQESPRSTARGEELRFWSQCSDKLIILSSLIDYRLRDLTHSTRLTSVTTHSTTLTFVLLPIATLSALIASEYQNFLFRLRQSIPFDSLHFFLYYVD